MLYTAGFFMLLREIDVDEYDERHNGQTNMLHVPERANIYLLGILLHIGFLPWVNSPDYQHYDRIQDEQYRHYVEVVRISLCFGKCKCRRIGYSRSGGGIQRIFNPDWFQDKLADYIQ